MSLPRGHYLIVSCEHGGNRIPARYRSLFTKRFLETHRGYDPGALTAARDFARATGAPLFSSTISRLLVELNRPLGHPQIFYKRFPQALQETLLRRYYFPYWRAVETRVARAIDAGRTVLHLSCHSFTPKFRGVRRTTDVGLLYDPRREAEARFCRLWRVALLKEDPNLRVHYNEPYRGAFPSLVDELRKKFPRRYVGIQIEINQKFPRGEERRWRRLRTLLQASFAGALSSLGPRERVSSASR